MLAACTGAKQAEPPPGVEFVTAADGTPEVHLPPDRAYRIKMGGNTLMFGTPGSEFPKAQAEQASEGIDTDHPILPTRHERESQPPKWQTPAMLSDCGFKELPAKFDVKPIVVHHGKLVANVRIQNPNHDYTSRVDVTVSRTETPVVLLLSNGWPVQWRIGQTARAKLAGVVLLGRDPAAVIGLPRSIPVFDANDPAAVHCGLKNVYFHNIDYLDGYDGFERYQPRVEGLSQQLFARSALGMTYADAADRIVFGDRHEAAIFAPYYSNDRGDVFERDPAVLLPSKLGLRQLEQRGSVRRATAEELDKWKEAEKASLIRGQRFGGFGQPYVVLRNTELPDGLNGTDFLLPDGVPLPHGDLSEVRFCIQKTWRCGSARDLRLTNE